MFGFSYLCANIPNEKLKSVRGSNIPNGKLKLVREELIKFDFHGRLKGSLQSLITVLFGSIINKNIDLFKYRSLKLAINYLLDNCCFTLGSMCFRK